MLKRISIQNYKNIRDITVYFESLTLMTGGQGKGACFEVLKKLQHFICGNDPIDILFRKQSVNDFSLSTIQSFSMSVYIGGYAYTYLLSVDHPESKGVKYANKTKVIHEQIYRLKLDSTLTDDIQVLMDTQEPEMFNYLKTGKDTIPAEVIAEVFEGQRSAAFIVPEFQEAVRKMVFGVRSVLFMDPHKPFPSTPIIVPCSTLHADDPDYQNWSNWDVLSRILYAKIVNLSNISVTGEFSVLVDDMEIKRRWLSDLSDGERQILKLYTALTLNTPGLMLFLDEPELHLSLSEVKSMMEFVESRVINENIQIILISQHPTVLDHVLSVHNKALYFLNDPEDHFPTIHFLQDQAGIKGDHSSIISELEHRHHIVDFEQKG